MKPPPSSAVGIGRVVEHAGLAGRDAFLAPSSNTTRDARRRPAPAGPARARGSSARGPAPARRPRPPPRSTASSPSQLVSSSVSDAVSRASRGPTMTWRLSGVQPDHEQRLAHGDVQAAALADGVVGDALVAAQHPAVHVHDLARPRGPAGAACRSGCGSRPRARSRCPGCPACRRSRRPSSARHAAHLRLRQIAQREAQIVELLAAWWRTGSRTGRATGRRARRSSGPVGPTDAADIVAGGHGLGAQVAGDVQQVAELHRLIAADAGDRRLAAQIGVGELLDHRVAEAAFVVEHIVRDAQRLGRRRASWMSWPAQQAPFFFSAAPWS